jgi:DNA recombination protein RmuC
MVLLVALTIGLALGFWLSRRINAGQAEVITEKLRAESAAELATARERVRGQELDVQKLAAELNELKQTTGTWRNDLDAARDERAQLAERAARVPVVEAEIAHANAQLQGTQARILQLSTSEAEKARELLGLSARNGELVIELGEAVDRVKVLNQSLSDALAQCSGLAADNERIKPLAEQIIALELENARLQSAVASLREDTGRVQAELQAEKDAHAIVRSDAAEKRQQLERAQGELTTQQSQLTEVSTRLESERQQSQEKLTLLLEAKEVLANQFKSLASDILEEKSKRFAEQNQTSLGQLLDPLKVRLQEFQGKVELFYDTEGKQRSALSQQVTQLLDLNKTLSDDAKNLTQALKGSSKSQGNWGELILERVLEASGLRKGEEYDVQESHSRDDGTRAQPDVVIHLPEDRHLVVDAKVSLTAYEEYASAESDLERQAALRRHVDSIKSHIKGLSEKNYQALYGLKSLDFVLMFVPIEPAFMLGVTQDNRLFMDAWTKNVLLVSPSTLLFVVRTVAHLWRQEAQNRNAQEIAKRGAELYDRLSAFVTDLEKVGDRLRQAQDSYSDAFAKLSTNKGNVIRQAEMLKELGVKPTKVLPQALLEASGVEQKD